jgi:hypothetical protein
MGIQYNSFLLAGLATWFILCLLWIALVAGTVTTVVYLLAKLFGVI